MPASIFGDRFLGREPAWHRLGQVMDTTGITATQAMEIAKIDFEIEKLPSTITMKDGTVIPTGQYGVVRHATHDDPQPRCLATVGSEWTAIQTWELAEMLDPITEQYPVETVGALGKGEKIFFSLDAGDGLIAGEDHKLYYLVTDHRDGSGALTIAFTPVRVVCQNTLTVGLSNAKIHTSLHHTKSIKIDAQWYMDLFQNMLQSKEQVTTTMNQLAEVRVTVEDAESIIRSAYPNPSRNRRLVLSEGVTPDDVTSNVWLKVLNDRANYEAQYDKAMGQVVRRRGVAWERYDVFNQEHPRLSQTAWAVWQAIVETEDYRKGKTDGSTPKAILYGSRAEAKSKGFAKALQIAKANS